MFQFYKHETKARDGKRLYEFRIALDLLEDMDLYWSHRIYLVLKDCFK